MDEKLKALWENMGKKVSGFTVGYDQFKADMQNEENLKRLHGNLPKYFDGFAVPYDQFKADMGVGAPVEKKSHDGSASSPPVGLDGAPSAMPSVEQLERGVEILAAAEAPPVTQMMSKTSGKTYDFSDADIETAMQKAARDRYGKPLEELSQPELEDVDQALRRYVEDRYENVTGASELYKNLQKDSFLSRAAAAAAGVSEGAVSTGVGAAEYPLTYIDKYFASSALHPDQYAEKFKELTGADYEKAIEAYQKQGVRDIEESAKEEGVVASPLEKATGIRLTIGTEDDGELSVSKNTLPSQNYVPLGELQARILAQPNLSQRVPSAATVFRDMEKMAKERGEDKFAESVGALAAQAEADEKKFYSKGSEYQLFGESSPFKSYKELKEGLRGEVKAGMSPAEFALKSMLVGAPVSKATEEATTTQVAKGVGQAGAFLAAGTAGAALRLPPQMVVGMLGGASMAQSAYDEAIGKGATPDEAAQFAADSFIIGASEGAVSGNWVGRLNGVAGGAFRKAIAKSISSGGLSKAMTKAAQVVTSGALQGGEEAAQEAFSQIAQNMSAKDIFDASRDLKEGVGEGAEIGFIIGALMGAAEGVATETPQDAEWKNEAIRNLKEITLANGEELLKSETDPIKRISIKTQLERLRRESEAKPETTAAEPVKTKEEAIAEVVGDDFEQAAGDPIEKYEARIESKAYSEEQKAEFQEKIEKLKSIEQQYAPEHVTQDVTTIPETDPPPISTPDKVQQLYEDAVAKTNEEFERGEISEEIRDNFLRTHEQAREYGLQRAEEAVAEPEPLPDRQRLRDEILGEGPRTPVAPEPEMPVTPPETPTPPVKKPPVRRNVKYKPESRTGKIVSAEPTSFRHWAMQQLLSGGIRPEDITRYTGLFGTRPEYNSKTGKHEPKGFGDAERRSMIWMLNRGNKAIDQIVKEDVPEAFQDISEEERIEQFMDVVQEYAGPGGKSRMMADAEGARADEMSEEDALRFAPPEVQDAYFESQALQDMIPQMEEDLAGAKLSEQMDAAEAERLLAQYTDENGDFDLDKIEALPQVKDIITAIHESQKRNTQTSLSTETSRGAAKDQGRKNAVGLESENKVVSPPEREFKEIKAQLERRIKRTESDLSKVEKQIKSEKDEWSAGKLKDRKRDLSARLEEARADYKDHVELQDSYIAEGKKQTTLFQESGSETDKIVSAAKKNGTYLLAPNGNKSNLNEKQWAQVRTKAFKDWFGDWENDPGGASKVVDENGEPLVLYHGSSEKFSEFDKNKVGQRDSGFLGKGFYFSTLEDVANTYRGKKKGYLYKVFLSAKNPLNLKSLKDNPRLYAEKINEIVNAMRAERGKDYVDYTKDLEADIIGAKGGSYGMSTVLQPYADIGAIARALGHDAVISTDEHVVFDPTQIKSATSNTGSFSPVDPNTLLQQGEPTRSYTEEEVDASLAVFDAIAETWAMETGGTVNDFYARLSAARSTGQPGRKGSFSVMPDGRALINLFETADVSTILHEIGGHYGRQLLSEMAAASPEWANNLAAIEKWAGVKKGEWTKASEEKFARAFEKYIRKGELPAAPEKRVLKKAFDVLKNALRDIYTTLKGSDIDVPISREVAKVFDAMLGVKPGERAVTPTGKMKQRGVSKTLSEGAGDRVKEAAARMAKANPQFYQQMKLQDALKAAKERIGKSGFTPDLLREISQPGTSEETGDPVLMQTTRQLYLMELGRRLDEALVSGDEAAAQRAIKDFDDLQAIAAAQATKYGQAGAVWAIWDALSPDGVLRFQNRMAQNANEAIKGAFNGSRGKALKAAVEDANKATASAVEGALDAVTPDVEKAAKKGGKAKSVTRVPTAKRKAAQDKTAKLAQDLAGQSGALFSSSVKDLSKDKDARAKIKALGESLIEQGVFTERGWKEKFKATLAGVGITASDVSTNALWTELKEYADKTRIENTAEKIAKTTADAIKKVIRDHYTVQHRVETELTQRLIEEAGLDPEDAAALAEKVKDEVRKRLQAEAERIVARTLGSVVIPQKRGSKDIVDKMIEMLNVSGHLTESMFDELFAEAFGLNAPLSPAVAAQIRRNASAVQALPAGLTRQLAMQQMIQTIADNTKTGSQFAEVLDKFISLTYASALSGPSTFFNNAYGNAGMLLGMPLWSQVANVPKFVSDLVRGKVGAGNNPAMKALMQYFQMLKAIPKGSQEFAEIMKTGGYDPKWEESVRGKMLKVGPLEKGKWGRGLSFDPRTWPKYIFRVMSASDRFTTALAANAQAAVVMSDILSKDPSLKNNPVKLAAAVNRKLTDGLVDRAEIRNKVAEEVIQYQNATGKEMSRRQQKLRTQELVYESLKDITPEQREEIKDLAGHVVFTSNRNGAYGQIASVIEGAGAKIKKQEARLLFTLLAKIPWMMFTRIPANIADATLDFTPYGFLRATRWSPTGILQRLGALEKSAQMGSRGSMAYWDQMGRASFGTIMGILAYSLLTDDDEDDAVEVYGRKGEYPNTIKIGNTHLNYLGIPAISGWLSTIGAYNDAKRLDPDKKPEIERVALAFAAANAAQLDQSYLKGLNEAEQLFHALAQGEGDKALKLLKEKYAKLATGTLPQNWNFVKQVERIFDPTVYTHEDSAAMLKYYLGIQFFDGQKTPNLDVFGRPVRAYPGESNVFPFTQIEKNFKSDPRIKFLYHEGIDIGYKKGDEIKPISNVPGMVYYDDPESPDGYSTRKASDAELYDLRKKAGEEFGILLNEYMQDMGDPDYRAERQKVYRDSSGLHKYVEKDVRDLWTKAKKTARDYMENEKGVKMRLPEDAAKYEKP